MRLEDAIRKIKKRGLVQLPEGLIHLIPEIEELAKKYGKEVVFDIDPVFGACDVREREAKASGCDTIIHVGHGKMVDTPGVVYVEWERELDVEKIVETVRRIKGRKCVGTTVNFAWVLNYLKDIEGVVIGSGSNRVPGKGIVLGCDTRACHVPADVNIFIGDGYFHPIVIGVNTKRKTLAVRSDGRIEEIDWMGFLKKRLAIVGATDGKKVGIIISSKTGQNRIALALELKELAEKKGYSVRLYVSDYLFPDYLYGLTDDFFVFTGCPRVATDDVFEKPVLTPEEFLLKLDLMKEYKIGWITTIRPLLRGSEELHQ